jgi:hypothetical protein
MEGRIDRPGQPMSKLREAAQTWANEDNEPYLILPARRMGGVLEPPFAIRASIATAEEYEAAVERVLPGHYRATLLAEAAGERRGA